jgi:hypothetical protein
MISHIIHTNGEIFQNATDIVPLYAGEAFKF